MILTDWILKVWHTMLSMVHIWTGSKLFPIVVIYSPDKEEVIGLTFTVDERYATEIMKIDENGSGSLSTEGKEKRT